MSLALLVTGAGGQLSTDLLDGARSRADAVALGLTRGDLDVTDPLAVADRLHEWASGLRADSAEHELVVINAAAYTAVDAAEQDEDRAYAVNATAPALLARTCGQVGARLVHVSTDYVFAGDTSRPYEIEDRPAPRSRYGRTKLAGERAVRELLPDASYVVRSAWLYGAAGANFVKTMARLEREQDTVTVVDDQTGSPTWSHDLAAGLLALAESSAPAGIYHATNDGQTTWFGFARAVFEQLGADPTRVRPTTTAGFPLPAPRPAYSVLSRRAWDSAGLPPLRPWREALAAAFARSGEAFRR